MKNIQAKVERINGRTDNNDRNEVAAQIALGNDYQSIEASLEELFEEGANIDLEASSEIAYSQC